jgi:hypothetical protein
MAPETPAPMLPPVVRGPSTRTLLTLDWSYPVYAPPAVALAEGATSARAVRKALTYEQAFAEIAGEDPRPLLVLRECAVCNGTDNALLSRSVDNERTFLMARWFHCVKLPVDVLSDDHPFRSLFPGGRSEHLFLATRDGAQRIALEGERSRAELWSAMSSVLASDYADEPERALKGIQRKLDRLDAADQRLGELQSRYDELLESESANSAKLKKARQKLAEGRAERDALLDEVKAAGSELELRHPTPPELPNGETPQPGRPRGLRVGVPPDAAGGLRATRARSPPRSWLRVRRSAGVARAGADRRAAA